MSGAFGSSQWMYNPSAGFYGTEIDNSLRFNDNDSANLSRTFGSAGNRKTWTWSGWMKRGNIGVYYPHLFRSGATMVRITDGNALQFERSGGGVSTSALFRDVSAWYHIVFALDTTQATASDRLKIYVNGVQQDTSGTYPALNTDYDINNNTAHYIGQSGSSSQYFDGYLADVNFIDGTALDASSFGETKSGIWIPKEYSGSYGTNGFYLKFAGNANDSSGNSNNWTANNISAHDYVPDSPTSNFPTMNKLWQSKGTWTTAEGNLQNTWAANNYQSGIATMGLPATGKWYWEIYLKSRTYTNWLYWNLVIADYVEGSGNNGNSAAQWSNHYFAMSAERSDTGYLVVSSGSTNSIASSGIYDTGNVIQVAFDADNKRLYLGDSGTWFLSADPGAESGDGTAVWYNWSDDAQGKLFPALNVNYFTYVDVQNFGQDSTFAGNLASGGNADANGIGDFKYSVPSGYLALCAANLPDPGIDPAEDEAPTDYFNTVTWSKTGADNSAITISDVGFKPDLVWAKGRSASMSHQWYDIVRGTGKGLSSDSSGAEVNNNSSGYISSFNTDGFTASPGSADNFYFNYQNGYTYVAWNWKAGGAAVSNTDGSITSSVSASPESGFSVVTYTGNGTAGATIGHGLGVKPSMIIVKNRDSARSWLVYHNEIGATKYLFLNDTAAAALDNSSWNDTEPTSSVFTVGTSFSSNLNTEGHVAYCFADIDGMVKAGSYVGNGSSDGPMVHTGFRPAWVMIKATGSTGGASNWRVVDSVRNTFNPEDKHLQPNTADAEDTGSGAGYIDFLSNGFKIRATALQLNSSGVEFVYLAFAEQPFKYANAR